ncbi:MAG TPA: hypothetical protein VFB04_07690 [Terriglobales bacterium]|nr:hypothetical protein [Terriglobales bacterium]
MKRDGVWYFHKLVKGKREFHGRKTPFSLDTRDLEVAKAKRDAILKAAGGAEVDRVLGRSARPAATLGEIFKAYLAAPAVRANEETRARNIADLVRMVRLVRGEACEVERESCGILTKQLVNDWQAKRLAAAAAEHADNLAALEGAKRSLNSLLTHAQSIFSAEARDFYGSLYLPPNIAEFMEALPVPARRQDDPEDLGDAFVGELLAAARELKQADAGAFAAFQLMTWGGLRNKECLHARRSWLEALPAAYRLKVKPTKDFLPKGNSRAAVLPAEIVDELLELVPEGDEAHLVPAANASERFDAIYRRLNAWLKSRGVKEEAGKIAYRLRKYFAKKVAEQQGLLFAQAALGHASMITTQNHYTGKPVMKEPLRLIS